MKKIILNSNLKKKFSLEDQKAQMEDRILQGRQITFMIYEYFRVTGGHEAVLDYSDPFRITLHGDDVQNVDTRWDEVLLSISEVPTDAVLEMLYKMRIRESHQLKNSFGNVGTRNDSKCIDAELSEVEDRGRGTGVKRSRTRNF